MKIVRLEQGKGLTISDEAFEVISRIVANHQICSQCHLVYTDTRPQVALNLCLPCFMGGYPQMKAYIGTAPLREERMMFRFLDEKGYVHYSTLDTTQLLPDTYETLRYWQYPVPTEYTRGDETIEISKLYWSIESDLCTRANSTLQPKSVVFISYTHRPGDNRVLDYFSYRNGKAELINKRRKDMQSLFTQARYRIESTMCHPDGGYLIQDRHTFAITDYDLLPVMATILNEQFTTPTQEDQA